MINVKKHGGKAPIIFIYMQNYIKYPKNQNKI